MKKKHVNNKYLDWKVRHLLFNIRAKRIAIDDVNYSYYNGDIHALPTIQLLHEYLGEIKQMITCAFINDDITEYQRDLLSRWCSWYLDSYVNSLSFEIFHEIKGGI